MAHKVHPKAYRLKGLDSWGSRWFNEKKMPQYLEEDFRIREFLKEKIGKLTVGLRHGPWKPPVSLLTEIRSLGRVTPLITLPE